MNKHSVLFSILIPAHNEEKYVVKCFESIKNASLQYPGRVEVIVTANRCTDRTVEIAKSYNAKVVYEDAKNLAKIRNAGAKVATGEIIITIDADSCMSQDMLIEIEKEIRTDKSIGGCAKLKMERTSPGIFFNMHVIATIGAIANGLPKGAGLFWCRKTDFDAIGGFDENLRVAEDIDFAKRLKQYGKKKNKKFIRLPRAFVVTSTRKFDEFGDWMYLKLIIKNFGMVKELFKRGKTGNKTSALDNLLDEIYFNTKRK
ncbi:MAG TPA: glycosyltransferase [Pseudobacteroides sp.]|nr:glycosyltransferase [Pseudobacteroides sp.]